MAFANEFRALEKLREFVHTRDPLQLMYIKFQNYLKWHSNLSQLQSKTIQIKKRPNHSTISLSKNGHSLSLIKVKQGSLNE